MCYFVKLVCNGKQNTETCQIVREASIHPLTLIQFLYEKII